MTVLLYPPDMVSIKGVDDMVPKATGKAQFLVIFSMYSFSLGHDGSPIYPPYNLQASYKTKISWTMHSEKTRLRPTGIAISFI
jgi:hypothetical protein